MHACIKYLLLFIQRVRLSTKKKPAINKRPMYIPSQDIKNFPLLPTSNLLTWTFLSLTPNNNNNNCNEENSFNPIRPFPKFPSDI